MERYLTSAAILGNVGCRQLLVDSSMWYEVLLRQGVSMLRHITTAASNVLSVKNAMSARQNAVTNSQICPSDINLEKPVGAQSQV